MQSGLKLPDRQPKNSGELVEAIARLVRDQYEQTGRPIDGSFLAYLLKQEYPALDYVKLGISKLSDAIRIGVERELVQRNTSVRHLEVTPYRNEIPSPAVVGGAAKSREPVYVRPDLWKAFVLATPGQKNFVHKTSGELSHAPSGGTDLAEVDPISESTQLKWLRDYLSSTNAAPVDNEESLAKLLRGGMRDLGREVELGWKIFRSRKVIEHVKCWAVRNGVSDAMVLTTRDAHPKARTEEKVAKNPTDDRFRRAVLAAIEDMTPEELDDLRLSVRSIRRHFSPR